MPLPALLCRICLDALHEKKMMSTKCGHIFCSECASVIFSRTRLRVPCPVCRKPNTYNQLIHLFPEWEPPKPTPRPKTGDAITTIPNFTVSLPPPIYSAPTSTTFELYVPLSLHPEFPWEAAGEVPAWDLDGTPTYVGITLFNGGWHPCKVKPFSRCKARVSYGGKEYEHPGMCHLLPFNPATMEWVPTSHSKVPPGRRPLEGGYEEFGGNMLYHALATVEGVKVPGKAGLHYVYGASVPHRNLEYIVTNYDILCWRDY